MAKVRLFAQSCSMLWCGPLSVRPERGASPVDFMTSVKTVLSKYADFSGRARRSEYWFFYLAIFLTYLVGFVVMSIVETLGALLLIVLLLGAIFPTLAVGVRRLHDTGKTGWLMLIGLIPFGGIVLIVLFALDSTPGDNTYGPNPKGVGGMGAPPVGYGMPPVA